MTASLGIRVIRSSLVDWWSMKKSADMRGTVGNFRAKIKNLKILYFRGSFWGFFFEKFVLAHTDPVLKKTFFFQARAKILSVNAYI